MIKVGTFDCCHHIPAVLLYIVEEECGGILWIGELHTTCHPLQSLALRYFQIQQPNPKSSAATGSHNPHDINEEKRP